MANTAADQHEMNRCANQFEQVNSQLGDMLNTLMQELEVLQQGWVGLGGRSFDAVKRAWHDNQAQLHKQLAETAGGIRSAGTNYTATDDTTAQQLDQVYGTIDLPLGGKKL